MPADTQELLTYISDLPDLEKLQLIDTILEQLDMPDPEIDRLWVAEARKRWEQYQQGALKTISYEEIKKNYISE